MNAAELAMMKANLRLGEAKADHDRALEEVRQAQMRLERAWVLWHEAFDVYMAPPERGEEE